MMNTTIDEIFKFIDKPKLVGIPNEIQILGNDLSKLSTLRDLIINNVNANNVHHVDSHGNNIALKLISFTLQIRSLDNIDFNGLDTVMLVGEKNLILNKDLASIFDHLIDNCYIDLAQENNKGLCFFQCCFLFESFSLLSFIFNKIPQKFYDCFNQKKIHFKHAKNNYMLQFLIDKIPDLDLSSSDNYHHPFFQSMKNAPSKKTAYISNKDCFNNLAQKQKLYHLIKGSSHLSHEAKLVK